MSCSMKAFGSLIDGKEREKDREEGEDSVCIHANGLPAAEIEFPQVPSNMAYVWLNANSTPSPAIQRAAFASVARMGGKPV